MELKVLLVDDEVLIRLGIKSIIEWERYGFTYIGDAPNGRTALEIIEKEQPDIVLTDIVMPKMNGLELIEAVKARYPQIRMIVLSSHNEYDYLRKAMKLGVEDYLLKASMKPEDLLELLLQMAEEIRASHRELKRQIVELPPAEDRSKAWTNWLHHVIEGTGKSEGMEAADRMGIPLSNANTLLLLRIHQYGPTSVDEQLNRTVLRNLVELELHKWAKGGVIPYLDNEWVLLLPGDNGQAVPLERSKRIAHDLISAAGRFLNASVSIGISRCFAEAAHIPNAYLETSKVLQLYFFEGKEKVFICGEHELPPNPASFVITKEEERSLKTNLDQLNEDGALLTIEAIFERMRYARNPVDHNIQACLQLLHLIGYASSHEGSPLYKQVLGFEQLEEAREWFGQLVRESVGRAKGTLRETYREEITQLLLYMKSHFKQDLSLKQAAQMANMSENYLSFIFKKETNLSFTEYMNHLRIEKAAELLLQTDMPGYRIAEEVGYENNNYFGRVFKKLKGASPQQYRNRQSQS